MSRRHYIPIWLLKQFRPNAPFCLDTTGEHRITDLGLKKAGQVGDAWSQEMEDTIMSPHDDLAATIFYDKIKDQRRIQLSDIERSEFAKWLCLFAYRVPDTLDYVVREWGTMKADKAKLSEHYSSHRDELVANLQDDYPEVCDEVIKLHGKEKGEQILFDDLMAVLVEHGEKLLPTAENVWHHNIQNHSLEKESKDFSGYHWTWYHCEHGLIIGDNPLVRWSPSENRSYRHVNRPGVESTIPLGANLCLRVQTVRRHDTGQRQIATEAQCHEFNRRQWHACSRFVYAGDKALLERFVQHN